MQMMILDSLLGQLTILVPQQLVINCNAVIGQGLAMTVVDTFAHLEELKIVLDGFLVFLDIVIKHAYRIV